MYWNLLSTKKIVKSRSMEKTALSNGKVSIKQQNVSALYDEA